MQRFTTQSGARMLAISPEDFDRLIRDERGKWGAIIKAAKISAE
jgi:tripartite-type tricarboxylate transporter receptor subunit TctC